MKTLLVSDDLHKRWKILCSRKEIKIIDATALALELAMRNNKKIKTK